MNNCFLAQNQKLNRVKEEINETIDKKIAASERVSVEQSVGTVNMASSFNSFPPLGYNIYNRLCTAFLRIKRQTCSRYRRLGREEGLT